MPRGLTVLNSLPAPILEKDCAVCKDQFSLHTEDPDEQVVITLPCKHPFHSPCILPWLKQNGTCPSCRHQLVPQPGSAPNPNGSSGPGPGPSTGTSNPPYPTSPANFSAPSRTETSSRWAASPRDRAPRDSPERGSGDGGGFLGMVGNLLHSLAGGHPNSGPGPSSSGAGSDSLPGGWEPVPTPHPEPRSRSSRAGGQSTNGPHQNSGPTQSQPSSYGWFDPTFTPSYNSNNQDRNGDSTNEWASRNPGRHRRRSYDRERERNRDRNGQRGGTRPWENPELD